MRFFFDIEKAVDAAAYLLELHGGKMEWLKLLKLLYLADRTALERWNRPITGDRFVAMEKGPVLSIVYNLVKGEGEKFQGMWSERIGEMKNGEVYLRHGKKANSEWLSDREAHLLKEIYRRFAGLKTFDLVDWIHANMPEWSPPPGKHRAVPIETETVLKFLGKTADEIDAIETEAEFQKSVRLALS